MIVELRYLVEQRLLFHISALPLELKDKNTLWVETMFLKNMVRYPNQLSQTNLITCKKLINNIIYHLRNLKEIMGSLMINESDDAAKVYYEEMVKYIHSDTQELIEKVAVLEKLNYKAIKK